MAARGRTERVILTTRELQKTHNMITQAVARALEHPGIIASTPEKKRELFRRGERTRLMPPRVGFETDAFRYGLLHTVDPPGKKGRFTTQTLKIFRTERNGSLVTPLHNAEAHLIVGFVREDDGTITTYSKEYLRRILAMYPEEGPQEGQNLAQQLRHVFPDLYPLREQS